MKYVVINKHNQSVYVTDDPASLYESGKIQLSDRVYQLGNEVSIKTKVIDKSGVDYWHWDDA